MTPASHAVAAALRTIAEQFAARVATLDISEDEKADLRLLPIRLLEQAELLEADPTGNIARLRAARASDNLPPVLTGGDAA